MSDQRLLESMTLGELESELERLDQKLAETETPVETAQRRAKNMAQDVIDNLVEKGHISEHNYLNSR